MNEPRDTLPPPSETSRVLLAIDALDKKLDGIEQAQRRQGMDVDLAMNALQAVLIELQLPSAAQRIKDAIARRHPSFDEGDVIAVTPPNGIQQ